MAAGVRWSQQGQPAGGDWGDPIGVLGSRPAASQFSAPPRGPVRAPAAQPSAPAPAPAPAAQQLVASRPVAPPPAWLTNPSVVPPPKDLPPELVTPDLLEFAQFLGMDPVEDKRFLWIAMEAMQAPLPPGWSEHTDAQGAVYFYNAYTDQSAWEHPSDEIYRQAFVRAKDADGKARLLRAILGDGPIGLTPRERDRTKAATAIQSRVRTFLCRRLRAVLRNEADQWRRRFHAQEAMEQTRDAQARRAAEEEAARQRADALKRDISAGVGSTLPRAPPPPQQPQRGGPAPGPSGYAPSPAPGTQPPARAVANSTLVVSEGLAANFRSSVAPTLPAPPQAPPPAPLQPQPHAGLAPGVKPPLPAAHAPPRPVPVAAAAAYLGPAHPAVAARPAPRGAGPPPPAPPHVPLPATAAHAARPYAEPPYAGRAVYGEPPATDRDPYAMRYTPNPRPLDDPSSPLAILRSIQVGAGDILSPARPALAPAPQPAPGAMPAARSPAPFGPSPVGLPAPLQASVEGRIRAREAEIRRQRDLSVLIIQAAARRRLARRRCAALAAALRGAAAVRLQLNRPAALAADPAAAEKRRVAAATAVQAAFRQHICRRLLGALAAYRLHSEEGRQFHLLLPPSVLSAAATLVQSVYRRRLAARRYARLRLARRAAEERRELYAEDVPPPRHAPPRSSGPLSPPYEAPGLEMRDRASGVDRWEAADYYAASSTPPAGRHAAPTQPPPPQKRAPAAAAATAPPPAAVRAPPQPHPPLPPPLPPQLAQGGDTPRGAGSGLRVQAPPVRRSRPRPSQAVSASQASAASHPPPAPSYKQGPPPPWVSRLSQPPARPLISPTPHEPFTGAVPGADLAALAVIPGITHNAPSGLSPNGSPRAPLGRIDIRRAMRDAAGVDDVDAFFEARIRAREKAAEEAGRLPRYSPGMILKAAELIQIYGGERYIRKAKRAVAAQNAVRGVERRRRQPGGPVLRGASEYGYGEEEGEGGEEEAQPPQRAPRSMPAVSGGGGAPSYLRASRSHGGDTDTYPPPLPPRHPTAPPAEVPLPRPPGMAPLAPKGSLASLGRTPEAGGPRSGGGRAPTGLRGGYGAGVVRSTRDVW